MNLKPFVLIPFLVCLTVAQETKRLPNVPRIARNWNSIVKENEESSQALNKLDLLLHARFVPKVIEVSEERRQKVEDDRRKACVTYYKQAREALLKQVDALNELIEEEDY